MAKTTTAQQDAPQNADEGVNPRATVVAPEPKFDSEALVAVDSFDAAIRLAQETLGAVEVVSETLGDGFAILADKDKNRLVGVPMVFMSWAFNLGDFGEFVSARVVVAQESGGVAKYIVNDGGAGIYKQLLDYTNKTDRQGGLIARRGLRRSDYTYTDAAGKTAPATTYYIDQSA